MDIKSLNFHHLFCFWIIAREGTIAAASRILKLRQSTLSSHLAELEAALGTPLFQRSGRRLVLTQAGRIVQGYADRLFAEAQALVDAIRAHQQQHPKLRVGLSEGFPSLVAVRILEKVPGLAGDLQIVGQTGTTERLVERVLHDELDLLLVESPIHAEQSHALRWHFIMSSPLALYVPAERFAEVKKNFPQALAKVPCVLPTANSRLRPLIEEWLASLSINVPIAGEFEELALLKAYAHSRGACFFMPAVEKEELARLYDVRLLVRLGGPPLLYFIGIPGSASRLHPRLRRVIAALLSATVQERTRK